MADLGSINKEIVELAESAYKILTTTFRGFTESNVDMLKEALRDEEGLDVRAVSMKRSLNEALQDEADEKIKKALTTFNNLVGRIELIGDCCVVLVNKIKTKINDGLHLTDETVNEYNDLYNRVEATLRDTVDILKLPDRELSNEIINRGKEIQEVASQYANNGLDRIAKKQCVSKAGTVFLEMLDATKSISLHSGEICEKIWKIFEV